MDLTLHRLEGLLYCICRQLRILSIRIERHARQQLLHQSNKFIVLQLLILHLLKCSQQLISRPSLKIKLFLNLNKQSLNITLDISDSILNEILQISVLPNHFLFRLFYRLLHLTHIQMQRSQTIQVFLRIVYYQLQRSYLMLSVLLVVAYSTNDTLMNAFGLQAD